MSTFSEKRLGRRAVLGACGLAGAGALFGSGFWLGRRSGGPASPEPVSANDPLRVYSGRDDSKNRQRDYLIDQWNTWNPDLPAEMIELPGVSDLQYSAIHARLQAGDPWVDVVNLDLPWIAEFVEAGYLRELEGIDAGQFMERPFSAGTDEERVFALPFNTDVGMLYYRKDNGIVTTEEATGVAGWDDLRSLVNKALARDPEINEPGEDKGFKAGISMQLDSYEGFTVNVWEYLLSNGVKPTSEGMIDFGSEDASVGLGKLVGDLHPTFNDPEIEDPPNGLPVIDRASLDYDEESSLAAFKEGRTPFLRHWPRAFRELQDCERDFEVGVVPMPGGVLGGQSLAVSAASERPVASQLLIEFLSGPGAQRILFEEGGFAATRPEPYAEAEALIEEKWETTGEKVTRDEVCEDPAEVPPRLDAEQVRQAMKRARSRPSVKRYNRFSRVFQDVLQEQLDNAAMPEVSDLNEALNEAIAGR